MTLPSSLPEADDGQPTDGLAWPEMAESMRAAGYRILGRPERFIGRRGTRLVLPTDLIARLRGELYEATGGICLYCRTAMRLEAGGDPAHANRTLTIEHRLPLARGGTWKRSNLAGACDRCNAAKGDLTEEEYVPLVEAHPPDASGKNFGRLRRAARAIQGERARASHQARLLASDPDSTVYGEAT